MLPTLLLGWIGAASVVAFAMGVLDKSRARRGAGRIPEATLLGVALAGGSPGLLFAMVLARHKTRKLGFLLPFVLIVALQAAALWWLYGPGGLFA